MMLRVTIIPRDGYVSINGRSFNNLDLSGLDPEIHAVQWYGNEGELELVHSQTSPGANIPITDLTFVQLALDAFQNAADAADATPPKPLLLDYRVTIYKEVKDIIYSFITDEVQCDFPEWKQANYASRLAELADLFARNGTISTDESSERNAILSVIAWKNTLLVERDRVKDAINAAIDHNAVDAAAASLKLTAPPLQL